MPFSRSISSARARHPFQWSTRWNSRRQWMSWSSLTSIDQFCQPVSANSSTVMSSFLSLSGLLAGFSRRVGRWAPQPSFSTPVDQMCEWVAFALRSSPQRQARYDWDCYVVQVSYIPLLFWLNLHWARWFTSWTHPWRRMTAYNLNFCYASLLGAFRAVNLVPDDTLFEMRSAFMSTVFRCRASLQ